MSANVQLNWLLRIKKGMENGWPLPSEPSFWLINENTARAISEQSEEDLEEFVNAGFINNPQAWELGMCADALRNKVWR